AEVTNDEHPGKVVLYDGGQFWLFPAEDDPFPIARFTIWVRNRAGAAIKQFCWPGGADHFDVSLPNPAKDVAPAADLIQNARVSNVTYTKQDNGQYQFTFQIEFDAADDTNFWAVESSVQIVTADGTPCPEEPNLAQERFGITPDFAGHAGGHRSVPIGPWWVPPAEWTGRTHRLRLYVRNRNGVRTVQKWPDGKTYFDLTPEVKYWIGGNYPNIPAPNVVQFDIGTQNPDGTFVRAPHWDVLNEKMIFDWAAFLPEDIGNLGYIKIWFQRNGVWIDSPMVYEGIAPGALIRDSFTLTGDQIPQPGEQITFICSSANKLGIVNQNPPGTPTGPSVTVTITAPDRGITASHVDPDALGPGIGIIAGQIGAKIGAGLTADANGYMAINPGSSIDVSAGKVVVRQGSLHNGFFAPGTIGADLTKFAADKRPVGVYFGFPSVLDPTVPDVIFNTYDVKIYRKVGYNWDAGVAPGDIIAGTISSSVTLAGTVYSNKIVEQGGGMFGVRLHLNLNNVTVSIANLWDASYGQYAGALVQLDGGNNRTLISYAGIGIINANGQRSAELSGAGEGYLAMGSGFTIQAFGDTGTMNARVLNARDASSNVKATLDGPNGVVNAQNGYRVGGIQIVDAFRNLSNVTLPAHSHASDAWFTGHAHDNRYYTKAEIDAMLAALGVP
ncbi:MAG TPA: hypothetical protein PLK67_10115, partial [Bryobacteraceae bacterium]|nr:hypothetical protein [Bryobacteraceae bacterium]